MKNLLPGSKNFRVKYYTDFQDFCVQSYHFLKITTDIWCPKLVWDQQVYPFLLGCFLIPRDASTTLWSKSPNSRKIPNVAFSAEQVICFSLVLLAIVSHFEQRGRIILAMENIKTI